MKYLQIAERLAELFIHSPVKELEQCAICGHDYMGSDHYKLKKKIPRQRALINENVWPPGTMPEV